MTTFQTISCLVLLAILVGAYMFYQAYKAKNTKIEFTPDNIKKTLNEFGALGIYEPSGGGFMFRSSDGIVWWLDTADKPIVKLITSWEPRVLIDWEKATSIADSLNEALMGQYLVYDKF